MGTLCKRVKSWLCELVLNLIYVKHLALNGGFKWKAILYIADLVKDALHFLACREELSPLLLLLVVE